MTTPRAGAKVPAKSEERYFFEFTGRPGRIYIQDYFFGRYLAVDGVASIRLNSPVTIYHDGQAPWSPLFLALRTHHTAHRALVKPKLPECVIRGERRTVERSVIKTVTWTIYKLFQVEVLHAAQFSKEGGVHYEFAFDDFEIVDRAHFSRNQG